MAGHEKLYKKGKTSYQLPHYLNLLELRPRAVWNAKPVTAANLPDCFRRFAKSSADPDRVMVQLLRLVVDEGLAQVVEALEQTQAVGSNSVRVIEYYLKQEKPSPLPNLNISGPSVEPPNLSCYDLLIGGGRL